VPISRQGIQKRFTRSAVAFLKGCLELLLARIASLTPIESSRTNVFSRVLIADSTQWQIHSSLARWFRGAGGAASKAICKLQTVIEVKTGKLLLCDYVRGTFPDQGYSKQIPKILSSRDLILFDLGYYSVKVFKHIERRKAFFIIPVYYHASLKTAQSCSSAAALLKTSKTPIVDLQLTVGSQESMKLRLVAAKVSTQKANRLRRKLREDYRRMRSGEPSEERLQFCNWTALITNVETSQLTTQQVIDLYATRWQIEIFFRDAKSLLKLDSCSTSSRERFETQLLATLFVAALLFFVYGRFNHKTRKYKGPELSLDKLIKRFSECASQFCLSILTQTRRSFLKAAHLIKKLLRNSIKFHQPSRNTPLQILENCGLS
jgi:transposase